MTTTLLPPATPNRPAKRRVRRRWPYYLLVLVLLGVGGWWGWQRYYATPATVAINPAELVTVGRGRVEQAVNSSCRVVSNLEVDIKCRASGEVIELPYDISQTVKKGALLCQLDQSDAKLSVSLAEATVAQTTAKLAQAKQDLLLAEAVLVTTRQKNTAALVSTEVKAVNLRAKADRQKKLLAEQLGMREELEAAETDASAAETALSAARTAMEELKQQEIQIAYKQEAVKMVEAQLQSDQITLKTQMNQLGYTTVTAPVDGVVSALNVQKGTIVASGMSGFSGGTTIMTVSDLSRVFVIATVDESDIGAVRLDQSARITVASFQGRTFAGKVMRIATKGVNASNVVTFEVKVEVLDEQKALLRPEMTGNVTIVQDERAAVLTLPASAILWRGKEAVVTTAEGEGRVVNVGLQGSDTVEIVSGLTEGESVRIVTTELPTRWKSQAVGPGGGPPPH